MTRTPAPDLTETWARFASEISYERLPSDAIPALKGMILDTLGTALAGSTLGDCAAAVTRFASANGGAAEATLLGPGIRVGVLPAALANGAFAHALNYDASGPLGGHIGVASVPAPLIMAERRGAVSGKELLAAVAVAAELTGRLAGALSAAGVDANEKFLEGQLMGYFGATVGAGRVLGFTPERMHNALGIALMQAAGTRQVSLEGGAAKAIYGGYSNHGAVMSVLLAEQDVDARCAVIEGRAGIYGLFYDGRYDVPTIAEGAGEDFRALDIRFKPWPTSNRLHPFIRAALALRAEHGLTPGDVARIDLQVSPRDEAWLEPRTERRHPHNAATAANSIYFGVAKALANGDVTLADVTAEGLGQPEVAALADTIEYVLDTKLSSGEAVVRILTQAGAQLSVRVGRERRPMSYAELTRKFRDCARYAAVPLSDRAQDELAERIGGLETVADVGVLLELLRAPAAVAP